MLWLALILLTLSGCMAAPSRQTIAPFRPAVQHPSVPASATNEHVRSAAQEELGSEAADNIKLVETEPPQPVDPGAAAMVRAMLSKMNERIVDEQSSTRVGLSQIRNQSRSSAGEFNQFIQRFASVLTRAGKDRNVIFVADPEARVHYQLQGTAYLISTDGFDVWELFLSATPSEKAWTVWQAEAPVRVLRQSRPFQQQVFFTK